MVNKILNLKIFSFTNSREIKLLILIGLIYRLLLFGLYLHTTQFPDSYSFRILAERMLDFNLNGYSGERSPGYPLFLFLAFGQVRLVVIYQFLMGIIASIYWYKTLLNFSFSNRTSLFLALFLQSFLHVFCYETSILSETISLLFISMIFYEITNGYFENKSLKQELYLSFLLGFLVIVKPFFAFLPFLIYGFAILKNFSFQKIISKKLLVLVFPLLSYFGWSYVNKVNTGYFVSTTFFGLNIAQNCVYFAENSSEEYDWISQPYVKHREIAITENRDVAMTIWYAYEAGEFDNKNLSFPDLSNELGKYGKETIKANQSKYWNQVITKSWLDFWNVFDMKEYVKFRIPIVDKALSAVWILQKVILLAFKFAFLILIPFYTFQFFRNRKITYELVIVTTIFSTSFLQAMVVFGTNSKYSFPFEYLMIIVVLMFFRKYFTFAKHLNTSQQ